MALSLAATTLIAAWTDALVPALPLLALAAVTANADLILASLRRGGTTS